MARSGDHATTGAIASHDDAHSTVGRAGVMPGPDGLFGTLDDSLIPGGLTGWRGPALDVRLEALAATPTVQCSPPPSCSSSFIICSYAGKTAFTFIITL